MSALNGREELFSTAQVRGELRTRTVAAFGYSFASSGADLVIRVASTAVLARLISPEDFGLFLMVVAVTALADQFRDLGLSTATIQRDRITHLEVTNLFWINVAIGVLLSMVVCALSPVIAGFFRDERLVPITAALSANFIIGALVAQHEALLTRQMRQGTTNAVRLAASVLSTVVAVGMAYEGFGYWSLVAREISRSAMIAAGMWLACPWSPGRPDRRTNVRSLVGFGKNLTLAYFLNVVSSSLDRFLLGRTFGAGAVALYRQPYQLVVAPMAQFMGPLYQVTLPAMSALQDDPIRLRRFYLRVVAAVAMFSMPLNVFLAVYADEVSTILLGLQWAGAAVFFRIFALGGILRSVASTTGFVLVSRGRSGALLRLVAANNVVMIMLMTLGLRWGPEGVAVGEAAAVVIMMWPCMHYGFRGSAVSIEGFLAALIRPAASSAVMGCGLLVLRWLWGPAAPTLSVAIGALCGGGLLVVIWWLLPGGRGELMSLTDDLRSGMRIGMARELAPNGAARS